MPLAKDFGNRLKELRSLMNLTQAQLAERCDLSVQYIGRIERGFSTPSFSVMERLCHVLDTEPANLFLFPPIHEPPAGEGTPGAAPEDHAGAFVSCAGIWRRDLETEIDHWSNSFCLFLGYPSPCNTASTQLFLEHVHEEDKKRVTEACEDILHGTTVSALEFRIKRTDGIVRDVIAHVDRFPPARGNAACVHVTLIDITDWRRLHLELQHSRHLLEEQVAALTHSLKNAVQELEQEHGRRVTSERRLKMILMVTEDSGDALAFVDASYVYAVVNRRYEELSGLPRQEIVGKRIPDLMGEEAFAARIKPHFDKALAGERVHYQDTFVSPSLGPRYMDVTYTPYIERGNVTGIVVTSHDFTEYQLARQALQEREERFRLMVENMPLLIHAHDEQGRYIYWNKESERVSGYSAEEILTHPDPFRLLYPDDSYRQEVFLPAHKLGQVFRNLVLRLTAKDGSSRTIAWSNISPLCPVPGWPYWEIGIDVTEQMRAEEALLASTELFTKAFDNDHMAVAIIRCANSAYLDANSGFLKMTGYSKEEVVGRTSLELGLVTEEQRRAMLSEIDSLGGVRHQEHTFQAKTGQFRTVLLSVSPITSMGEDCLIITMVDITGRKLADEALKRSEAYLRTVLESTEDLICTRDSQNRLVRCNQAFADFLPRILHVEAEPGLRTLDFLPNEIRKHWEMILKRIFAGEQHRELFSVEMDGKTRWYDLSLHPIVLDGSIVGTAEFTRDVTLLKEVEESFARKAELLQKAEVLADMGAWELDLTADVGTFSENWRRVYGVTKEHLTREDLNRVTLPEDLPRIEEAFRLSMETGIPVNVRHRILRGDTGEMRHVQLYGEIEFCPRTGAPLRMVGATQDITRRVLEEGRLLAAYVALDNSRNGILFTDFDGVISYSNPSFHRLFHCTLSEEVTGRILWDFLTLSDTELVLHDLLEQGQYSCETCIPEPDGGYRDLRLEAQLVCTPDGEPLCLMWTFLVSG